MMHNTLSEEELINKAFDKLWPLFRSITGKGIEDSLNYLSSYMPLTIEKIPSGTNIFDWVTPPEWQIRRGRLWAPDGQLICDTDINNLHIVNYSEPVSATFSLEQLQPHLHSIKHLPDAIPYVTSYYTRTWGFCLTENVRQQLKPGNYKVEIDATFDTKGSIPYGYHLLQGESDKEILLASYLCHPSLANNELSGPLVLLALYRRIKAWPRRRYSYRFLLNPETIGSLCFLHNHHQHLKQNLVSGLILTCLGGPVEKLRYKQSKRKNTLIDHALEEAVSKDKKWLIEEFTPLHGSDERQYCAPGFNLPVGQVVRSAYGQYSEYHNSLDDKDYMDVKQLIKSVDQLESLLKLAEISGKPVNQSPFGEPQLGKRGLYPNTNSHETRGLSTDDAINRKQLDEILTILSLSDGCTPMKDIAKKCNSTVSDLAPVIERLEQESLLKYNAEPIK